MSQIVSLVQTLAKGGPVMIPLVACSIVALAVVVERLAFWWRQGDEGAAQRALELAERGKLDEALEVARRASGPTARVVAAGLAERHAAARRRDGSRGPGRDGAAPQLPAGARHRSSRSPRCWASSAPSPA